MIAFTSFCNSVSLHDNLTLVELCLPYHYLNSARIYQIRVAHVIGETLLGFPEAQFRSLPQFPSTLSTTEILPSRHVLHSSAKENENCWFSERPVGFTSKEILVDKN